MLEKDLQEYLFNNPTVLFPDKKIQEISKEYYIEGRRIDLLARVDGVRYIVELKRKTIERDDIGQVVEYYGLMKNYLNEANLRMMLVAPSIPEFRRVYLEELGIICVEINETPKDATTKTKISKEIKKSSRKIIQTENVLSNLMRKNFTKDDINESIEPQKLAILKNFVNDLLPSVNNYFKEFEIIPYTIRISHSNDFNYEFMSVKNHGVNRFQRGGAWFALSFGPQNNAPNNTPNISVIMFNHGIDFTINAEINSSQNVFLAKVRKDKTKFDSLLSDYKDLTYKSYLKFEHMPRAYHFILADYFFSGEFNSATILTSYQKNLSNFEEKRDKYIAFITERNKHLTEKQIAHLKSRNKNLNFAMRLPITIYNDSKIFEKDYANQLEIFKKIIFSLKPFIEFFT